MVRQIVSLTAWRKTADRMFRFARSVATMEFGLKPHDFRDEGSPKETPCSEADSVTKSAAARNCPASASIWNNVSFIAAPSREGALPAGEDAILRSTHPPSRFAHAISPSLCHSREIRRWPQAHVLLRSRTGRAFWSAPQE